MFDVVVPTYNNLAELKACLDGFVRQTMNDFRVLVCVDGSTDGTLEFLSGVEFPFEIKVLVHPGRVHKGRSATRNLCLPHLNAEYLLLLDSDMVPDAGLLENHGRLLRDRDCISIGDVVYTNADSSMAAAYLQSRGRGRFKHNRTIPGHYLNTQNVAMRSVYFSEIGGQDENFGDAWGGEDIELGLRLANVFNLPMIVNRSAVAYSECDKTLLELFQQMETFGAKNLHLLLKKHPDADVVFNIRLFTKKTLKGFIVRLFLRESLCGIVEKLLPCTPKRLKPFLVHYAVFYHLYKGYASTLSA